MSLENKIKLLSIELIILPVFTPVLSIEIIQQLKEKVANKMRKHEITETNSQHILMSISNAEKIIYPQQVRPLTLDGTLSAFCWHPHRLILFAATANDIHAYYCDNPIRKISSIPIFKPVSFLVHSFHFPVLIAAHPDGALSLWHSEFGHKITSILPLSQSNILKLVVTPSHSSVFILYALSPKIFQIPLEPMICPLSSNQAPSVDDLETASSNNFLLHTTVKIKEHTIPKGIILDIACHRSNHLLAASTSQGEIILWNHNSGTRLSGFHEFYRHPQKKRVGKSPISILYWYPDSKLSLLLAGSADGYLYAWDLENVHSPRLLGKLLNITDDSHQEAYVIAGKILPEIRSMVTNNTSVNVQTASLIADFKISRPFLASIISSVCSAAACRPSQRAQTSQTEFAGISKLLFQNIQTVHPIQRLFVPPLPIIQIYCRGSICYIQTLDGTWIPISLKLILYRLTSAINLAPEDSEPILKVLFPSFSNMPSLISSNYNFSIETCGHISSFQPFSFFQTTTKIPPYCYPLISPHIGHFSSVSSTTTDTFTSSESVGENIMAVTLNGSIWKNFCQLFDPDSYSSDLPFFVPRWAASLILISPIVREILPIISPISYSFLNAPFAIFYRNQPHTHIFPSKMYYISHTSLMEYNFHNTETGVGSVSILNSFPSFIPAPSTELFYQYEDGNDNGLKKPQTSSELAETPTPATDTISSASSKIHGTPSELCYNYSTQQFLIFFETEPLWEDEWSRSVSAPTKRFCLWDAIRDTIVEFYRCIDAAFISDKHIIIVSPSFTFLVSISRLALGEAPIIKKWKVSETILQVFTNNNREYPDVGMKPNDQATLFLGKSNTPVLFLVLWDKVKNIRRLLWSKNKFHSTDTPILVPCHTAYLQFDPDEECTKVIWQPKIHLPHSSASKSNINTPIRRSGPGRQLLAILTNKRVILATDLFQVLASIRLEANSIFWVLETLFVTTPTTLLYITQTGHSSSLLSLSETSFVIASIFPRHVVLQNSSNLTPVLYKISMFEPLLAGFIDALEIPPEPAADISIEPFSPQAKYRNYITYLSSSLAHLYEPNVSFSMIQKCVSSYLLPLPFFLGWKTNISRFSLIYYALASFFFESALGIVLYHASSTELREELALEDGILSNTLPIEEISQHLSEFQIHSGQGSAKILSILGQVFFDYGLVRLAHYSWILSNDYPRLLFSAASTGHTPTLHFLFSQIPNLDRNTELSVRSWLNASTSPSETLANRTLDILENLSGSYGSSSWASFRTLWSSRADASVLVGALATSYASQRLDDSLLTPEIVTSLIHLIEATPYGSLLTLSQQVETENIAEQDGQQPPQEQDLVPAAPSSFLTHIVNSNLGQLYSHFLNSSPLNPNLEAASFFSLLFGFRSLLYENAFYKLVFGSILTTIFNQASNLYLESASSVEDIKIRQKRISKLCHIILATLFKGWQRWPPSIIRSLQLSSHYLSRSTLSRDEHISVLCAWLCESAILPVFIYPSILDARFKNPNPEQQWVLDIVVISLHTFFQKAFSTAVTPGGEFFDPSDSTHTDILFLRPLLRKNKPHVSKFILKLENMDIPTMMEASRLLAITVAKANHDAPGLVHILEGAGAATDWQSGTSLQFQTLAHISSYLFKNRIQPTFRDLHNYSKLFARYLIKAWHSILPSLHAEKSVDFPIISRQDLFINPPDFPIPIYSHYGMGSTQSPSSFEFDWDIEPLEISLHLLSFNQVKSLGTLGDSSALPISSEEVKNPLDSAKLPPFTDTSSLSVSWTPIVLEVIPSVRHYPIHSRVVTATAAGDQPQIIDEPLSNDNLELFSTTTQIKPSAKAHGVSDVTLDVEDVDTGETNFNLESDEDVEYMDDDPDSQSVSEFDKAMAGDEDFEWSDEDDEDDGFGAMKPTTFTIQRKPSTIPSLSLGKPSTSGRSFGVGSSHGPPSNRSVGSGFETLRGFKRTSKFDVGTRVLEAVTSENFQKCFEDGHNLLAQGEIQSAFDRFQEVIPIALDQDLDIFLSCVDYSKCSKLLIATKLLNQRVLTLQKQYSKFAKQTAASSAQSNTQPLDMIKSQLYSLSAKIAWLYHLLTFIPLSLPHWKPLATSSAKRNMGVGNWGVAANIIQRILDSTKTGTLKSTGTLSRKYTKDQSMKFGTLKVKSSFSQLSLSASKSSKSTLSAASATGSTSGAAMAATNYELKQLLLKCRNHNLSNSSCPPYDCPFCGASGPIETDKCLSCFHPILFCFKSFFPIATNSFVSCPQCQTTFNPSISPTIDSDTDEGTSVSMRSVQELPSLKCLYCGCNGLQLVPIQLISSTNEENEDEVEYEHGFSDDEE